MASQPVQKNTCRCNTCEMGQKVHIVSNHTWSKHRLTTGGSPKSRHKGLGFFDVLLTVHLSIFILVINQLDAHNLFYNKFISCLYMFRAHALIVRRSKLYYTASGVITPIGVLIPEAVQLKNI
jgi:hypothetical protein